MKEKTATIKTSVRSLIEFILREGDLSAQGLGVVNVEVMQMGSRIHRKIQKSMGVGYESEVPLSTKIEIESTETGEPFTLVIEGRADGIIHGDTGDSGQITLEEKPTITIDEIKGVLYNIKKMKEPEPLHLAQALVYAYMVLQEDESLKSIGVQITYCHMESEFIRRFNYTKSRDEIYEWFDALIEKYKPWAVYEHDHAIKRTAAIQSCEFPFDYREGQKELIAYTYKKIEGKEKLFIEAPTGVGKTISTVFPAIKAMGEGLTDRIFYLTAKTITRTVAEECFNLLMSDADEMRVITLTAKEKLCILDKPACSPTECERAKGHYDRVNDAIYEIITKESRITANKILEYSEKYKVCPFELSLDVALFTDAIICDYNYVFDPRVRLKRFFDVGKKNNSTLLVDEAHNLVERGREMYSASIIKEDFLECIRIAKKLSKSEKNAEKRELLKPWISAMESVNKALLTYKKECGDFSVLESIGTLPLKLMRVAAAYEAVAKDYGDLPDRETVLSLYFSVKSFLSIHENLSDDYKIYAENTAEGFELTLGCMEPGRMLSEVCGKVRSSIFFSATLLPIGYYREQLGGETDDAAVYAQSSFSDEQRKILIARDVTSLYKRRSPEMYSKIAEYIQCMVAAKRGNYIVFFPSYAFLEEVCERVKLPEDITLLVQGRSMKESEREDYLRAFEGSGVVGFFVMGGIFGEGIDLTGDKLIGTVIVGTGLPMVCDIRELYKTYFDEKRMNGFDYAYRYPGLSKVLQAGGRLIRTSEDRGVILLLDERFLRNEYTNDFPREWRSFEAVTRENVNEKLDEFWGLT